LSRSFKTGLFLTIMLFFYQGTWWDFGKQYSNVARWAALGVMCIFALSERGRARNSTARVRTFALAFAAVAVFSSAWSRVYPVYTLQRGFSVLIFAIFLCFAFQPRLRGPRDWASLVNVLVASAWVMTALSVVLWATGTGESVRWSTGAVQGAFGNPNGLGMVYAILIPVTLGRFYHRKGLLTLALLALSVALLVFCRSRAGWLGAFVGVTAFYACLYGRKLWVLVFVVLVLLAGVLVLRDLSSTRDSAAGGTSAFQAALLRGETDSSEYGSGRIPLWTGALEKWKRRPFVGYGFGTAGDTYYVGTNVPARFHSSLVQITAELGIVGAFFFIAPLAYSFFKSIKSPVLPALDARHRALAAGLAGGWFGGVADSLFESWLFAVGNVSTILAWICFFAAIKAMSEGGGFLREKQ